MTEIFTSDDEHLTEDEIKALPRRAFAQEPVAVLRKVFGACRLDARVAFGSRRPDRNGETPSRWLAHISVEELMTGDGGKLDRILAYHPDESQYVAWNPIWIGPAWKQGLPETDEPAYFPVMKKSVAQVRALYVDLDVGRDETEHAGMSGGGAIASVLVAGDQWGVPAPSLVGVSGRGAYALWLIRPLDIAGPIEDPVTRLWETAERQLVDRMRNLSVDPAASCIVQWLKRPGTVDSKTGNLVTYYTLTPQLEDAPQYDLADIAARTKPTLFPRAGERTMRRPDGTIYFLPPVRKPPAPRMTKRPPRPGDGTQPAARRIRDLKALNAGRGGIKEGSRRDFLFLWNTAMTELVCREKRGLRAAEDETFETAFLEAARFDPPMGPDEVLREVRSIIAERRHGKVYQITNDAAAKLLHVSTDEAEALDLRMVPDAVKDARKKAVAEHKEKRRSERAHASRLLVAILGPAARAASRERVQEPKRTPERSKGLAA